MKALSGRFARSLATLAATRLPDFALMAFCSLIMSPLFECVLISLGPLVGWKNFEARSNIVSSRRRCRMFWVGTAESRSIISCLVFMFVGVLLLRGKFSEEISARKRFGECKIED